jgi:hypothetical protein
VVSLQAKIDDLVEQDTTLLARNDKLVARIAELEGRAGKPPKTPTNSLLPQSSGRKANVANAKKGRKGHPDVTRELCANPDVTRHVHVKRRLRRETARRRGSAAAGSAQSAAGR